MPYSIQHTAYSIQHTAYSIQHTAYSIQHTAYNIQHTVYIYVYTFYIEGASCEVRHSGEGIAGVNECSVGSYTTVEGVAIPICVCMVYVYGV
jgi:hypothetical protein